MAIRKEQGYIYSPNSIYHGDKFRMPAGPRDEAILYKMELERLRDFVEFLFDHSEHCDHITQREAWDEFEIYEAKNSYHADKIREKRKQLKQTP